MPTRITQHSMNSKVLFNLQARLASTSKVQEQLSSGKTLNRPSDDPTGTVVAMKNRADIRSAQQDQRNANDGYNRLATADQALTGMLPLVNRVKQLVTQSGDGGLSQADRDAMAAEVTSIRENMIALANTDHLGQPVFAGSAGVTAAYDAAGNFLGNTDAQYRAVGNEVIQVNVDGRTAFGPAGNDLFKAVSDIANDLTTNNQVNLTGSDMAAIDAASTRITTTLATVGARTDHIDTAKTQAKSREDDLTSALADVESVDLPKTLMDLSLQQTAYQAALGAAQRVIQPSLLDYLR